MIKRIKYPYLILLGVHVLLSLIAFKDFRLHPSTIIFSDAGDGLKNYFTLLSYVKSQHPGDLFSYNIFNYPFGEYVFTTDNTPLFAIPFKWFCRHVYNLSDHTLAIYNGFIVVNIIICGLLCFAILKRLLKNDLFAIVMAVILPWSNMQVVRIWRGHFNLSLSCLILLAVLLTIIWQERKEHRKKQYLTGLAMIFLNYAAFLAHGYYIAIIGVFQSAVLFFFGIYCFKSKAGKFSIVASVVIPVVSLALALVTLKMTDGFYDLRSSGSGGYDWMETKVRFWGLFTAYDFHHVFFPIKNMKGSIDPENMGYLGNVGLYILLGLVIASLVSRSYRSTILATQRPFFKTAPYGPLFFGCLLLLFICFGEHYYTGDLNDGMLIHNFLNPFYLIHQFSDVVTQFRALGRFAWLFFWGFNIWMLYTVVALYPSLSRNWRTGILAGIIFLGGAEVKDYVDAMQSKAVKQNPLYPGAYKQLNNLHLDFSRYQAMLSLPYYNVGAEQSEYVLDDYDASSTFSYQMALHSGLPLMNVKLSRTVLPQARMLDSAVAYDYMPEALKNKLSDKPVLVFINKVISKDMNYNRRPVAEEIQAKANELPVRHHLQPVDSLGDYIFYEWYPKNPI